MIRSKVSKRNQQSNKMKKKILNIRKTIVSVEVIVASFSNS